MKRSLLIGIAILGALLVVGSFALDWRLFSLTGHFSPKRIVDSLNDPLRVVAVSERGLVTSDGQTLLPPLVSKSHMYPELGRDILANGVELRSDGTMYVLVHVHHWCGNDPVRYHLARVDVSSLLQFVEHKWRGGDWQYGIDPASLMMVQIPHGELRAIYEDHDNRSPNNSDAAKPFE